MHLNMTLETNLIFSRIEALQGRVAALRRYL
jgi:hypothetical protein